MKLTKLSLIGCVVAGLLSTSAMAKDFDYDIHVGVSNMDIKDGDNGANYTIGYGVTKTFDNKVVAGVSFDLDYANVGSTDIYGVGADLKLGYNVYKDVNVYALGGYKIQSVEGDSAYGFGYGAGIDYAVTRNIVAAVEYKTYDMSASNFEDYKYQTLGASLKYRF